MTYVGLVAKKSVSERIPVNIPQKHIIHKAIKWQKMLDDGIVTSLNEIAKRERLSRARVTPTFCLDFQAGAPLLAGPGPVYRRD